jgi:hypothetical protein
MLSITTGDACLAFAHPSERKARGYLARNASKLPVCFDCDLADR